MFIYCFGDVERCSASQSPFPLDCSHQPASLVQVLTGHWFYTVYSYLLHDFSPIIVCEPITVNSDSRGSIIAGGAAQIISYNRPWPSKVNTAKMVCCWSVVQIYKWEKLMQMYLTSRSQSTWFHSLKCWCGILKSLSGACREASVDVSVTSLACEPPTTACSRTVLGFCFHTLSWR